MHDTISFRTALPADLDAVVELFEAAKKHMCDCGIYQWDEIYPDAAILKADIQAGQMTICEIENSLAAAFTLNTQYDKEYESGSWQHKTDSFYILHGLCVHPAFQNKGVGKSIMLYIEYKLKSAGVAFLRLDAFSQNPYSIKLYEHLGYNRAGEVSFRKGRFYLYEKAL